MTGDGDTAIGCLRKFFDPSTRCPCRADTHASEAGPVSETPLSASRSLHDVFCQSWGGVVPVFPGVPPLVNGRTALCRQGGPAARTIGTGRHRLPCAV